MMYSNDYPSIQCRDNVPKKCRWKGYTGNWKWFNFNDKTGGKLEFSSATNIEPDKFNINIISATTGTGMYILRTANI